MSRLLLFPLALLVAGCQSGIDEARPLPALDEAYFRCRVQPVLAKNCAAFACHGDTKRYFRVFARNRLRAVDTEAERNALFRDSERSFNLDAARAFVDPDAPEESLLLTKPLDQSIGGYYHGATALYPRGDVFTSKDDPDYQTLLSWVQGAKEDPACVEPGSDL